MEPISWGRYGWGFIHNVALGYSETPTHSEKENYKLFFEIIGKVLPCERCRQHYNKELGLTPPDITSRDSLFKWTVDIHNKVNKRLGKDTITYDEAYVIWLNKKDTELKINNENSNNYMYCYVGLFIAFLAILLVHILLLQ